MAHLLVHLSPEAGWQKRVLAVVGARNYIKAVMVQSRRFEEMSLQVEQLLLADQEAYFAELNGPPRRTRTRRSTAVSSRMRRRRR